MASGTLPRQGAERHRYAEDFQPSEESPDRGLGRSNGWYRDNKERIRRYAHWGTRHPSRKMESASVDNPRKRAPKHTVATSSSSGQGAATPQAHGHATHNGPRRGAHRSPIKPLNDALQALFVFLDQCLPRDAHSQCEDYQRLIAHELLNVERDFEDSASSAVEESRTSGAELRDFQEIAQLRNNLLKTVNQNPDATKERNKSPGMSFVSLGLLADRDHFEEANRSPGSAAAMHLQPAPQSSRSARLRRDFRGSCPSLRGDAGNSKNHNLGNSTASFPSRAAPGPSHPGIGSWSPGDSRHQDYNNVHRREDGLQPHCQQSQEWATRSPIHPHVKKSNANVGYTPHNVDRSQQHVHSQHNMDRQTDRHRSPSGPSPSGLPSSHPHGGPSAWQASNHRGPGGAHPIPRHGGDYHAPPPHLTVAPLSPPLSPMMRPLSPPMLYGSPRPYGSPRAQYSGSPRAQYSGSPQYSGALVPCGSPHSPNAPMSGEALPSRRNPAHQSDAPELRTAQYECDGRMAGGRRESTMRNADFTHARNFTGNKTYSPGTHGFMEGDARHPDARQSAPARGHVNGGRTMAEQHTDTRSTPATGYDAVGHFGDSRHAGADVQSAPTGGYSGAIDPADPRRAPAGGHAGTVGAGTGDPHPQHAASDLRRSAPTRGYSGTVGQSGDPQNAGADIRRSAPTRGYSGTVVRSGDDQHHSADLRRSAPAGGYAGTVGRSGDPQQGNSEPRKSAPTTVYSTTVDSSSDVQHHSADLRRSAPAGGYSGTVGRSGDPQQGNSEPRKSAPTTGYSGTVNRPTDAHHDSPDLRRSAPAGGYSGTVGQAGAHYQQPDIRNSAPGRGYSSTFGHVDAEHERSDRRTAPPGQVETQGRSGNALRGGSSVRSAPASGNSGADRVHHELNAPSVHSRAQLGDAHERADLTSNRNTQGQCDHAFIGKTGNISLVHDDCYARGQVYVEDSSHDTRGVVHVASSRPAHDMRRSELVHEEHSGLRRSEPVRSNYAGNDYRDTRRSEPAPTVHVKEHGGTGRSEPVHCTHGAVENEGKVPARGHVDTKTISCRSDSVRDSKGNAEPHAVGQGGASGISRNVAELLRNATAHLEQSPARSASQILLPASLDHSPVRRLHRSEVGAKGVPTSSLERTSVRSAPVKYSSAAEATCAKTGGLDSRDSSADVIAQERRQHGVHSELMEWVTSYALEQETQLSLSQIAFHFNDDHLKEVRI